MANADHVPGDLTFTSHYSSQGSYGYPRFGMPLSALKAVAKGQVRLN